MPLEDLLNQFSLTLVINSELHMLLKCIHKSSNQSTRISLLGALDNLTSSGKSANRLHCTACRCVGERPELSPLSSIYHMQYNI